MTSDGDSEVGRLVRPRVHRHGLYVRISDVPRTLELMFAATPLRYYTVNDLQPEPTP